MYMHQSSVLACLGAEPERLGASFMFVLNCTVHCIFCLGTEILGRCPGPSYLSAAAVVVAVSACKDQRHTVLLDIKNLMTNI